MHQVCENDVDVTFGAGIENIRLQRGCQKAPESDDFRLREKMMNTGLRLILLWIKLCTKRQVHQSVTKVSLNSDRCSDIDVTFRSKSTWSCSSMPLVGRKVPRIGRILLTLAIFAVTGFVILVLIGLWDRYETEATALGFSGPYERYLASQAGF